jgi:hypothetical protein
VVIRRRYTVTVESLNLAPTLHLVARVFGAEFPFHLVDSAHHRQEAATSGGAGIDAFA